MIRHLFQKIKKEIHDKKYRQTLQRGHATDKLLAYIILRHTDQVNKLLAEKNVKITLSEKEEQLFFEGRTISMQLLRIIVLYGDFLIQHIHRLYRKPVIYQMDEPPFLRDDAEIDWPELLKQWPVQIEDIPVEYLFEYVPFTDEEKLQQRGREERQRDRETVWHFKYNHPDTTPRQHVDAMQKVWRPMGEKLKTTFGKVINRLTMFCIPASEEAIQWRRYHEFSRELCKQTGMTDSFPYVKVTQDRKPAHEGGEKKLNYILDKGFFKGRQILVFDDILTTGSSLKAAARLLREVGAKPVAAFFIGRTRKRSPDNTDDLGHADSNTTAVVPLTEDVEALIKH